MIKPLHNKAFLEAEAAYIEREIERIEAEQLLVAAASAGLIEHQQMLAKQSKRFIERRRLLDVAQAAVK